MLGLWRIKFYIKQKKWRLLNKHNETGAINNFDFNHCSVGKNTYGSLYIVDFSSLDTKVKIGSYCSIATGVKFLLGGEHNLNTISTYPFKVKRFHTIDKEAGSKGNIIVDDDVWIGENALILSGVHIGQGAVVAAGAVVTKDVEPYAIVGGNPAKVIKYRFNKELIEELSKINLRKIFEKFSLEEINEVYENLNNESLRKLKLLLKRK